MISVKKRLFSSLLILCILLGMLPGSVLATSESDMTADAGAGSSTTEEDLVPEFIPGIIPEEIEFVYPTYQRPSGGPNRLPSKTVGKYDAREDGYQSPVKNQGSNGLCWTFGTYAALEAYMLANGGDTQNFSEIHMGYSTSNTSGNVAQGWERKPGGGGNRGYAAAYLMRGTGLSGTVDEEKDPYTNIYTELPERVLSISEEKEHSYTVRDILFLTGSTTPERDSSEMAAIKSKIMSNGGVGASMYWADDNATATSGGNAYYNAETASYYYDGNHMSGERLGTNHLIEIAGWDDAYPKENFNAAHRPEKNGAWLVKNSWGSSWGENGYCWISYDDTNFPLNTFCIDGVESYDSSATVYETDYKGTGNATYAGEGTGYCARVYKTKTANESLTSVRVMVYQPCTIEVDCVSPDKLNNTYTFTSLGQKTAAYSGWFTVDLDDSKDLGAAGSDFAVVVKLTADSTAGDKELYMCYDANNAVTAGQTYKGGSYGTAWENASWNPQPYNFCIKAVTTPANPDLVTAQRAANDLTWDVIRQENVKQGETGTDLYLPDGFRYGTTVSWSSEPAGIISTNGKITHPSTNTDVTLTAVVRYNGQSATKNFELTVLGVSSDVTAFINGITWDAISSDPQTAVKSNLDLSLSELTRPANVTVTWESTKSEYINPNNGAVTQPRFDKENEVTLTAVVIQNSIAVKRIPFVVNVTNAEPSGAAKVEAANEWFRLDPNNNWWGQFKGKNLSMSAIRYNLELKSSFEVPMEKGGTFTFLVDVPATSTKNNVTNEKPWKAVSGQGKVTRPAYGQNDTTGYFYIYEEGHTTSCITWTLTVLAYKGEITLTASEDLALEEGENGVLSVTAKIDGVPGTVAYQWYKSDSADGSDGTPIRGATGTEYAFTADSAGTWYYYCEASALDAETVQSNVITVTVTTPVGTTAMPAASPADGTTFYDSQSVTLSCTTADARIYYTLDGSTPTASSTLYTAPITLSATTTVKAIAAADGLKSSGVLTAVYTKLEREDVSSASVTGVSDTEYTGSPITPSPVVVLNGKTLTVGTDYTVSYADNTDAGAATVTITGIGTYTGSQDVTFRILQATPAVSNVRVVGSVYASTSPSVVSLTGDISVPGSIALTGSPTFKEGTTEEYDWTFTPDDTRNYTTVSGKVSITVSANNVQSIVIKTEPTNKTYEYGDPFDPAGLTFTVTYFDGTTVEILGSDFNIKYSSLGDVGNNKTVTAEYGGAQVTITDITVEPKKVSFVPAWSSGSPFTFDGNEKTVTITNVPQGVDVTYTDNTGTAAGSYIATASFSLTDKSGNYVLDIIGADDNSVTQSWSIEKAAAKTYTITYPVNVSDTEVKQIDLSIYVPQNAGTVTASVSVASGENAASITEPAVNDRAVEFRLDENAEIGQAVVTVVFTTDNYNDITIEITVDVSSKIIPVPSADRTSVNKAYDGRPIEAAAFGAKALANGEAVAGVWSFKDGKEPTNVADSGIYTLVFTPDSQDYSSAELTVIVTITAAALSGEPSVRGTVDADTSLGNVILEAPSDWPAGVFSWPNDDATALVTAGTAYTWLFTPDEENYAPLSGTIVLLTNSPHPPASEQVKIEVESGISNVPPALTNHPNLNTPAKLEEAMRTAISQISDGISPRNIAVYDLTLMVSTDGGNTWEEASKDSFPSDGKLTVTLPYPEGTDSSYRLTVVHMFTTYDFGKIPGETESPAVTNVTDGIRFAVTGLSPISVGWTRDNEPSNSSDYEETSDPTYQIILPARVIGGSVKAALTDASEHQRVILTVKPNSGYMLDKLTVMDNKGDRLELTDQGNGKYAFTMPASNVVVDVSFAVADISTQNNFTDVQSEAYYYSAVQWAVEQGITAGTTAATFSPDDACTRAQIVTFLWRAAGSPSPKVTELPFTDVSADAYYYSAVLWAVEQGITSGTSVATFSPDATCTRAQTVTFLWRVAGSPSSKGTELSFTDVLADAYYYSAVLWAVEQGITSGTSAITFSPNDVITRGQTVTFLYRNRAK